MPIQCSCPGEFSLIVLKQNRYQFGMFLSVLFLNMTMKKNKKEEEEIKPDLKHDTMEFSAPSEGKDQLDTDDATYEEEEITPEELETLEDNPDNEAAALNAVETDRQVDEDNLPEEDWTDDISDDEADEEESHPGHRR